jgi:hypothetical protein
MADLDEADRALERLRDRYQAQDDEVEYLLTSFGHPTWETGVPRAGENWRVVISHRRVFWGATPDEAVDKALHADRQEDRDGAGHDCDGHERGAGRV